MATLISTLDLQALIPTQQPSPQTKVCIPFHTEFPEIPANTMDSVSLLALGRRVSLVRSSTAGRTYTTCGTEMFTRRGSCCFLGYRL